MLALITQATNDAFTAPSLDWHAIAPELVLLAVGCLVIILDSVLLERARPLISGLVGLGFLGAIIPIITLSMSDVSERVTFSGAFVVNDTALVLKVLFLLSAYVIVLLSTNYIADGEYWESEYYTLMILSVLGMCVMASARDLVTIFVALELLSIPAYMLASWRKRDVKSTEAGLKYYLMGVFASAVLLYGMSFLYGVGRSTNLSAIGQELAFSDKPMAIVVVALVFTVIGFAFKVSAVPFHMWAPDTYEGAPTPVTAFLAVASKAAGFVALIQVVFVAFGGRADVVQPLMFVLAVASMTVGNLIALRQTNLVRMLAYSGIAQAGFMLAPFAVYESDPGMAMHSVITYLLIYAAMNLGAFALIIIIARRTGSAERSTFAGLFVTSPGLAVAMTVFLASLIGFPPFGGWYAKFGVTQVLVAAETGWGWALAVIMAVNTAIAAFYYLAVARTMFFDEPIAADGDAALGAASAAARPIPFALKAALAITLIATIVTGVQPDLLDDATSGIGASPALVIEGG